MKKKNKTKSRKGLWSFVIVLVIAVGILFYIENMKFGHTVKVYFTKGGSLAFVERQVKDSQKDFKVAGAELVNGPTNAEAKQGFTSLLPSGTKILSLKISGDKLVANFNNNLSMYGGGTSNVQGALAQIVYTFTDIKGIRTVMILVDGQKEVALGSEGFIIDKPLKRSDVLQK